MPRKYVRSTATNTPERVVAKIRNQFELGIPILHISRNFGVARLTVYRLAERFGWKRPGATAGEKR